MYRDSAMQCCRAIWAAVALLGPLSGRQGPPNLITRHLDLSQAHLVLTSLGDLPLWELLRIARERGRSLPTVV